MSRRARTLGVIALAVQIGLTIGPRTDADPMPLGRDRGARAVARPESESFVLHCSGCHRIDGSGIESFATDLREIGPFLDTEAGRAYLVRVPGVAQAPIDNQALASLLNWILREIASSPPDPAYSAEEVAALRRQPLRDPLAARKALLASEK